MPRYSVSDQAGSGRYRDVREERREEVRSRKGGVSSQRRREGLGKTAQDVRTGGLSSIACVLQRDGFDRGWTDGDEGYDINIEPPATGPVYFLAGLTMLLRADFWFGR
jgi:hypothetical protein